jgi:regulator of RNase E activity RraA
MRASQSPCNKVAFWGEVQSTVHLGLGMLGCVTNGSFRDLDMLAPGFQLA